MEIPEYNSETIPRIKNSAYWPYAKFLPVLSETAIRILEARGALEKGQDINGEDTLRIKINNKVYTIPRILTSKKSLSWLGFTKERVNELWETLLKVSSPMIIPSINDGGEWAFWVEIKLWIGDEIYAISKRSADKRDDAWNNTVLSRIGINDTARLQPLKIKGEKGLIYTFIQEQKPQDLLPLIQRYIYHRWHLLSELNKLILVGSSHSIEAGKNRDWLTNMGEQFETNPIDLDFLYGRSVTWGCTEWKTY